MTGAAQRTMYGKTDYTRESLFLHELDKSIIEGDAIYKERHASLHGWCG